MTSTQLPTPVDAVTLTLSTLAELLPEAPMTDRYDYARRAVLASIITDAETNTGRRVRYYADQLDRINYLAAMWHRAGAAAELCTIADHYDRFPDAVAGNIHAIDNHIRAHLPHNTPES